MLFGSHFNSQSIVRRKPKNVKPFASRPQAAYSDTLNLDPGFEGLDESPDCTVAPGVQIHFDSTAEVDDEDLQDAVRAGDYFQQPLIEIRAAE